MSWGEFLGKIANHFQNREERRRNEIDKLEQEEYDIMSKKWTPAASTRLLAVRKRLHNLYRQAKNC